MRRKSRTPGIADGDLAPEARAEIEDASLPRVARRRDRDDDVPVDRRRRAGVVERRRHVERVLGRRDEPGPLRVLLLAEPADQPAPAGGVDRLPGCERRLVGRVQHGVGAEQPWVLERPVNAGGRQQDVAGPELRRQPEARVAQVGVEVREVVPARHEKRRQERREDDRAATIRRRPGRRPSSSANPASAIEYPGSRNERWRSGAKSSDDAVRIWSRSSGRSEPHRGHDRRAPVAERERDDPGHHRQRPRRPRTPAPTTRSRARRGRSRTTATSGRRPRRPSPRRTWTGAANRGGEARAGRRGAEHEPGGDGQRAPGGRRAASSPGRSRRGRRAARAPTRARRGRTDGSPRGAAPTGRTPPPSGPGPCERARA